MTKPVVSVALLMLIEEGRILLSDPVHLYLGEPWKKKNMTVFRWTPGSAVLWDNRAVWHCAVNNYKGMYRLMHRITLEGTYLESADPSQIGSMPLDDCGEVSISIACSTHAIEKSSIARIAASLPAGADASPNSLGIMPGCGSIPMQSGVLQRRLASINRSPKCVIACYSGQRRFRGAK